MKFSTRGRYALRLMLDLAMHDTGEYVSLKDVSERQQITLKYLEQIVTALTRAGYLKSLRGNSGGYRLSKPASQYKVGDILRVTEGSIAPIACLEDEENTCERAYECGVLPFWTGLYKIITEYVDGYSLQDLADEAAAKGADSYSI